jgi:hypothetical protein
VSTRYDYTTGRWRRWLGFHWYSLASNPRRQYEAGTWIWEPGAKFSRTAYRIAPALWRRWANRNLSVRADPKGDSDE